MTLRRCSAQDLPRPTVCVIQPYKNAYSETFIHNHAQRLPAHITTLHGGFFPTQDSNDRLLFPYPLHLAFIGRRFLPAPLRTCVERAADRALARLLHKHHVDIVLAEYGPTGASVMEACRRRRVPLVVHFHGFDAHHTPTLREHRVAYSRLFAFARALVVVSHDMHNQLLHLGARPETLFLNPYGVDLSFFRGGDPAAAPPTFVTVGRFTDKKAPHLSLLAFHQVHHACPEARLIMIGDGELWEACKQMARALSMQGVVDFVGARSPAEVAEALRGARAFVQHSLTTSDGDAEGTPVALLEAGATGLPVVSTRHAGIKDAVLHGQTGYLVEEADVHAMAEAMLVLAKNGTLASELGRNARQHIKTNFSLERSIDGLWDILRAVLYGRCDSSGAVPYSSP